MRRLLCLVVLFALSSPSLAEEKPPGYDTPEEALKAYITGFATEDYELAFASCTPQTRAYHIGLAMFSIGYGFNEAEAEALMREHGMDDVLKKLGEQAENGRKQQANETVSEFLDRQTGDNDRKPREKAEDEEPLDDAARAAAEEKQFVEIMLLVKDPAGLMRKVAERGKKIAEQYARDRDDVDGAEEGPIPPVEKLLAAMKVADLEIEGDTATCRIECDLPEWPIPEETKGIRYKLRRIEGRWYCDHDPR